MVYVLKGWTRAEFDGHGEHLMKAGSCWIQPAGIKHTVLEYSDDLEVLEIILPARYDTVEVDEPPGGHPGA
jgi:quercetin dioxygenase-like cupin family protein